jgi:hypothetical protein
MTSAPQVDVEELKRQLRREVLGDLRPILEALGIQFPDIGGVISDEERRSSSGLVEDHDQPLPSIEPDTIDNLAQPTAYNFILLVRSFRMEVERGLVYPHHTMLDDVQIDTSSYAMVKVDMVHDNSKELRLEVPPHNTILTMRDAVIRRVQWIRTSIDVDPSTVDSASTTPSQSNTSSASMSPEARLSLSPNPEQLRLSPIRDQLRLSLIQ